MSKYVLQETLYPTDVPVKYYKEHWMNLATITCKLDEACKFDTVKEAEEFMKNKLKSPFFKVVEVN